MDRFFSHLFVSHLARLRAPARWSTSSRRALVLAGLCTVVGCSFLAVGCASTGPVPGTGDISFRLRWDGEADLDLHVTDPLNQHVGIVGPGNSPSAEELDALQKRRWAEQRGESVPPIGELDVDCNASPDRMCARPIENIYWKPGTAPRGSYRAWVVLFRPPRSGDAVSFELEIRLGERVVETIRDEVEGMFDESTATEFEYEGNP